MKNCIILGCGRSGTSMVAGALAGCGYFLGGRLHRARQANPKGFFEARRVNAVNDAILRSVVPARWPVIGRWLHPERLGRDQMWLARVPPDLTLDAPPGVMGAIRRLVRRRPFCFKDPRFCYTLGVWRPLLPECVFVCVFRDPAATVVSILTECRLARYGRLPMDADWAFDLYRLMYGRVLDELCERGDWLFVQYDQVLSGEGIERLAEHVGARVDVGFPERRLNRSRSDRDIPPDVQALYARLCRKADWSPGVVEASS